MTTRLTSVVIDAADPGALANWWSDAIGWPITYVDPDEVVVEPAGNEQSYDVPALVFGIGDDPKTTKNRVHLDLASDSSDHQAAIVERLARGRRHPRRRRAGGRALGRARRSGGQRVLRARAA